MLKKGSVTFSTKWCLTPLFFLLILSGCTPASYRGDKLKEEIANIARQEYGIDQCDVEMNGTTLGVFLPLKQLFAMDFKEALMSGKVTNMEQLFQPSEEAVNKVEDMLFSMSRVMLSTDRKIDFYYLQATDVEKTGMELSFLGNIDDVKKVRFWDIPRSEYRKRMIHDIQLNRAVIWHRPVRQFFKDLGEKTGPEIQELYFKSSVGSKWAKEFFFADTAGNLTEKGKAKWEVLQVRSLPIQDNEVMVYVKARAVPVNGSAKPEVFEYLFEVMSQGEKEKIRRIIPMAEIEQISQASAVPLTRDIIYKSLDQWESEFKVPDMTMGDFLALQLTRRIQEAVATDERIRNTFSGVKLIFKYSDKEPKHFSFFLTAPLKSDSAHAYSRSGIIHEDILYLWELAAKEFAGVIHGYGFQDWQYLELGLTQTEGYSWKAGREDMETFRKGKRTLQDILSMSKV